MHFRFPRSTAFSGSILLMTLVMFGMFSIVTISVIGFINAQQHAVSEQEQREQAFGLAEAGVHYTLWALESGTYDPQALKAQTTPVVQQVNDPNTKKLLGDFTLTFGVTGAVGSEIVTVASVGHDATRNNLCATVIGQLQRAGASTDGTTIPYKIIGWNRQPSCNQNPALPSPSVAVSPSPSGNADSGLLAHWQFDEGSGSTANSTSAGPALGLTQDGTGAWTTGWTADAAPLTVSNCSALQFDGVADRAVTTTAVDSASLTLSTWAKVDAGAAGAQPIFSSLFGWQGGIRLYVNADDGSSTDGSVHAEYAKADASGVESVATAAGVVTPGTWVNILLTFNATDNTTKIYVDGVERASQTGSARGAGTTVQVGKDNNSTTGNPLYFKGGIDEITVYNRVVTSAEIAALAAQGSPTCASPSPSPSASPWPSGVPANLASYWKLDETYGQYAAADSGASGHPLSLTHNGGSAWFTGWTSSTAPVNFSDCSALQFDNTSAYGTAVAYSQPKLDSDTISLSGWIHPTSGVTGQRVIMSSRYNNFSEGFTWYLDSTSDSDIALKFEYFETAGRRTVATVAGDVPANAWSHVAVTFDPATKTTKLYVNGVQKGTYTDTQSRILGEVFYVGKGLVGTNSTDSYFQGTMDDLRVYTAVLSDADITALAATGTPSCPTPTPSPSPSVTPTPTPLPSDNPLLAGLLGYWKFDEGNSNVGNDSSGNGHNGTLIKGLASAWTTSHAPVLFTDPYAITFDGNNDYMETIGVTDSDTLSFSVWLYPTSVPNSLQTLVSSMGTNSNYPGNTNGYQLVLSPTQQGTLGLYLLQADSTASIHGTVSTSASMTINAWHHVVLTMNNASDSNTVNMYLDGQHVVTNYAAPHRYVAATPTYVGKTNLSSPDYFKGTMDDVRIYNRVLSASEVQSLYAGD
jgi:hypothetical protein